MTWLMVLFAPPVLVGYFMMLRFFISSLFEDMRIGWYGSATFMGCLAWLFVAVPIAMILHKVGVI